jgi:flagellar biosynthetic protein FliO
MRTLTAMSSGASVSAFSTLDARTLGGSSGPDFTRYLLVCGGLVVFVVALGWGTRKLIGARLSSRAARRSLQVLDVLPLGQKQRLALVRCAERTFLLGLGDKEVSLVAELEPAREGAAAVLPAEDRAAFAAILAKQDPTDAERGNAPVAKPVETDLHQRPTAGGWVA